MIPLNYDAVFRELLQTWNERSDEALKLAGEFGTDLITQLLGWSQGAADIDDNFLWTHAFDVILYRFVETVREAVKVRIANSMFPEIMNLGRNDTWSIIGHSLGTAVVHDTLHSWFTESLGSGGQLGLALKPQLIMMIANVSKTLQTRPKVLDMESAVRPGKGCTFYYTVYHPLDPFTLVAPFKPVVWPDRERAQNGRYRFIQVDHIQQANIHDLAHYLRHPDVIIPLMRNLNFRSFVTNNQEAAYRSQFNPLGELTDPKLIEIRQKLSDIGIDLPGDWKSLLLVWQRFNEFLSVV